MMVEIRQNGENGEMADGHAAFARLADASAKLFAGQAAAMAAMTAFGISIAGLMLGALKPAEGAEADTPSDRPSTSMVQAVVRDGKPAPEARTGTRAAKQAAPGKAATKHVAAGKSRPTGQTAADDLKRISGIGPRLEKVLRGRGISTYAQIAGLSASALKKIDDELGLEGRVVRDDWAGQARALAAGRPDAAR
jgi:NADH-quinone oxidoreductase subunit E